MVCALHRLFQSESDDRVMEHGFDPGPEHPPCLEGEQALGYLMMRAIVAWTSRANSMPRPLRQSS